MRSTLGRALRRLANRVDPAPDPVLVTIDPGSAEAIHKMLLAMKRRNGGKDLGLA